MTNTEVAELKQMHSKIELMYNARYRSSRHTPVVLLPLLDPFDADFAQVTLR